MDRKKPTKKSQELTVEKLRTYPGLEELSDKEAQEIVFSLDYLANLLWEHILEEKRKNDNVPTP